MIIAMLSVFRGEAKLVQASTKNFSLLESFKFCLLFSSLCHRLHVLVLYSIGHGIHQSSFFLLPHASHWLVKSNQATLLEHVIVFCELSFEH